MPVLWRWPGRLARNSDSGELVTPPLHFRVLLNEPTSPDPTPVITSRYRCRS